MSERELLHTDRVLVVEGKYDAARLSHLTDALILLTDGFGIYKDKKRQQLFKALAKKNGLILFTDSDAAGFRIRTYITNLVGPNTWCRPMCLPSTARKAEAAARQRGSARRGGRGRRHRVAGAQRRPRCGGWRSCPRPEGRAITYADLYDWGLSGTPGSAERKYALLNALGLPPRLSKKELVEALNRLYRFEELDAFRRRFSLRCESTPR